MPSTPKSAPTGFERPVILLGSDAEPERYFLRRHYLSAIETAGGIPLIVPCTPEMASPPVLRQLLDTADGVVLTGGDDPAMEPFGIPTHPAATVIDPDRQAFEFALITACQSRPALPILGICLGMQLMAIAAGGHLDQYLPDTLATASVHMNHVDHELDPPDGPFGRGPVHSHHRQAITDAGTYTVTARAPDGTIEAIEDPSPGRSYCVGIQWHPERTSADAAGTKIFRDFVTEARRFRQAR